MDPRPQESADEGMAREGRAGTFSFDAFPLTGSPCTVLMLIEHKDVRDLSWVELTHVGATVPGRTSIRATDIKERLRVRFEAQDLNAGDGVRIRTLPPFWTQD